ncbi:type II secretion system F family protein [Lagierella sp.]|uniref:type II secretion system F family protein n=1 Tax=Lagierella sp. TaxID=2849657 RepID=UPI0026248F4F|nr:type II secretion system F family protein [Lagierella sp.]
MDITKVSKILNKPIYLKQNNKHISIFLNEFSSLLRAGINSEEAIYILKDQKEIGSLNEILNSVYEDLIRGQSLSESFLTHGNFEEFLITMIKTGEETGRIQEITKDLSQYYKRIYQVDKKVQGAMVYPVILMVTAIFVLFFIFTYVMPTFLELFRENDQVLPLSTRILIAIVNFFNDYGNIFFISLMSLIIIFVIAYKKTGLKKWIDKVILKLPIIGKNYGKILTSRIAMALSISTKAGVNFLDSLEIISQGIGNRYLEDEIGEGLIAIENGDSISETFKGIKTLPNLFSSMIEVGEKTGELSEILKEISRHYKEESDYAIDNIIKIFEPVIIIVMAIIIGFIVISIATPMFDLINNYSI